MAGMNDVMANVLDWRREYGKEMRVSGGSGCEVRMKTRPAGLVV